MIFRKGWRGSVAVRGAVLGRDRAGGGAGFGIPEPEGKQRGVQRLNVPYRNDSMNRSEFHV